MKKKIIILIIVSLCAAQLYSACNTSCQSSCLSNCYPRTIFVPRQLSYNPILEQGLTLAKLTEDRDDWRCAFSAKPLYTQNVGCKFNRYFNINQMSSMNVQEDGSGIVDSLWFQVISSDPTFYSSNLAFNPIRQTYGAMLFLEWQFNDRFALSINTAVVTAKNNMRICESSIDNLGTVPDYLTVTESLATSTRTYGRVCGSHSKTGVDDIQIKLIGNICNDETHSWDVYGLVGAPTGVGSKSVYMFEPLVGSRHAQLGLGTTYVHNFQECSFGQFTMLSELKWRYGLSGKETRLFDLTANGQWSRYMLLVNESDPYTTFFATKELALQAKVTPRNSVDFYLALHANKNNWHAEIGYDLWYRDAECVKLCCSIPASTGIADLVGIAALSPYTASTANISEGVQPGINQAPSDSTFVPLTTADLNLASGAAPRSLSNSIYLGLSYTRDCIMHLHQIGASAAYEIGNGVNVPNNVTAWVNLDFEF